MALVGKKTEHAQQSFHEQFNNFKEKKELQLLFFLSFNLLSKKLVCVDITRSKINKSARVRA